MRMLSWSTSKLGASRSSSLTIGASAPAPPPLGTEDAPRPAADAAYRLRGTRIADAAVSRLGTGLSALPTAAQCRVQRRASMSSDPLLPWLGVLATGCCRGACWAGSAMRDPKVVGLWGVLRRDDVKSSPGAEV